jgi:hypothetical protein
VSSQAATHLDEVYRVDCYAADPADGYVLDPVFRVCDPDQLVPGARIIIGRSDVSTMAELTVDLTDVTPDLVGTVCLDAGALDGLSQACRHFMRNYHAGQAEIDVSDDGYEYHGHYGDDRPPDTARVLHLGRVMAGDGLVFLRLDLLETHGTMPTCWLDLDALHDLFNAADCLAEGL